MCGCGQVEQTPQCLSFPSFQASVCKADQNCSNVSSPQKLMPECLQCTTFWVHPGFDVLLGKFHETLLLRGKKKNLKRGREMSSCLICSDANFICYWVFIWTDNIFSGSDLLRKQTGAFLISSYNMVCAWCALLSVMTTIKPVYHVTKCDFKLPSMITG